MHCPSSRHKHMPNAVNSGTKTRQLDLLSRLVQVRKKSITSLLVSPELHSHEVSTLLSRHSRLWILTQKKKDSEISQKVAQTLHDAREGRKHHVFCVWRERRILTTDFAGFLHPPCGRGNLERIEAKLEKASSMKIMSSLCSVVRAPEPAEEGESKKKIAAMLEETSSTNVEVFLGFSFLRTGKRPPLLVEPGATWGLSATHVLHKDTLKQTYTLHVVRMSLHSYMSVSSSRIYLIEKTNIKVLVRLCGASGSPAREIDDPHIFMLLECPVTFVTMRWFVEC